MTRLECSEVRDLIHAYVDGELSPDEREAVASHLGGCEACSRELASLERLRRLIAAAGTYPPPSDLADRVRGAIGPAVDAEEPSRRRWLALAASHVAAAAAAGAAVAWVLGRKDREAGLVAEAVAVHVRSTLAGAPVEVASADQHTVRPWFTGRIDYAPPVRDLAAAGFPLHGGRVDYFQGGRVAALVFGRRRHTVNVLVVPAARSDIALPLEASVSGFNIVAWQMDAFAFVAVSDVGRSDLLALRALLSEPR